MYLPLLISLVGPPIVVVPVASTSRIRLANAAIRERDTSEYFIMAAPAVSCGSSDLLSLLELKSSPAICREWRL